MPICLTEKEGTFNLDNTSNSGMDGALTPTWYLTSLALTGYVRFLLDIQSHI